MTIYIEDASGVTADVESRARIKQICRLNNINCSERADTKKIVKIGRADIIIAHLGFITTRDLAKIKERIDSIREVNKSALLIAVSSTDTFLDKSRELGVPSFKYSYIIKIIEEAIKHLSPDKTLSQSIKEIISNITTVDSILRLFLPLDITLQALARAKNKAGYWEALKPKEVKLNYYAKFDEFKSKVADITAGIECLKEFSTNASGEIFKLIDASNSLDELMNYRQPFHHWYCNLAACLHGKKICNEETE